MNLKTGTNRPVQSQAVYWASAGLVVGPLADAPSGRKAAAAAGHTGASRSQRAPVSAVDYVFIMDASERPSRARIVPAIASIWQSRW
jgi:hypothetical protein